MGKGFLLAKKKIFIKTFGCQMNDYDTERLYRLARTVGYHRALRGEEADLIVVNTCSVREKPEHKAVSEIGWMHKRARSSEKVKIVLAGCVAQQMGENFLKKNPFLSGVLGTGAVGRFGEFIRRMEKGKRPVDCRIDADSLIGMPKECLEIEGQSDISAFVSIMRGCDNYCSYCIVPYVRGPEISRTPKEILNEIQQLAKQGVKEVTLLGQNVNSYGNKLAPKKDFVDLADLVAAIDKIKRIRFTTNHPKDLSPKLIKAFTREKKLAGHIHLAVQSGSDKILKRMNRKYSVGQYIEMVDALRQARPGIAVTSDIIVGFCGETDDDFDLSLELLRNIRFDNLFSFMYSPRPGTTAEKFSDDVPLNIKKKRLDILQTLQKEITLKKNRALVGKTMEVLVTGNSRGGPDRREGRADCFRVVHFDGPGVNPGDMVAIKILEGHQNALVARYVNKIE